jgi:hypothetical protein
MMVTWPMAHRLARELQAAEEALGIQTPQALRELYEKSNGIIDQAGQWWVVCPSEQSEMPSRRGTATD